MNDTTKADSVRQRLPIDAIVTHHTDGFRSGVARFNELLAKHLDAPLLTLRDQFQERTCPLLSFKASELGADEVERIANLLHDGSYFELFLHEYGGLEIEERLVLRAQRVHCGNREIQAAVAQLNPAVDLLWTPGLIIDARPFEEVEIWVFSFGMAHKIQTARFRRLKELLDNSGSSYAIYVSAANHETALLRDAQLVFEEMHDIFPRELYFLGNLSDVAVYNWLRASTFFAAFFDGGVRGNNTSVGAALEQGAVVITNLDRYSPEEYVHLENIIDIDVCEELVLDPAVLSSIRARATESVRGWDELTATLRQV
jgi:hypothetical protein